MGDLQFLVILAVLVFLYVVVKELGGKIRRLDRMESKIGELDTRVSILEDDVDHLRWLILKRLYCSHGEEDGKETT